MGHAQETAAGRHRRSLVITRVLTSAYLVTEIVGRDPHGKSRPADAGHMLTDAH
jgi:Co/Zn/Cd efflux system component